MISIAHWLYRNKLEIPYIKNLKLLLHELCYENTKYIFQGLPTDTMSSENATILMNSTRWPLMIDPQLQGLKWIKNRYGEDLQVLRLTQTNYLALIEVSIANGAIVLIENIMESIDPVLDPVIKRDLIKKGRYSFFTIIQGVNFMK